MRIGIDARQISHKKRHGLRTYVENLIHALSKLDQTNEYILYLDAKDAFQLGHLGGNFSIRILPWRIRYLSTLINDHFLLPQRARRDRLDVMHYPAGPVNGLRQRNAMATIHDAIPLFLQKKHFFTMGAVVYLFNLKSARLIKQAGKRMRTLITVSESSKHDLMVHAGIPADKLEVIHPGVNERFRRTEEGIETESLKKKYNLGKRVMLGFLHKNSNCFLSAFKLLPTRIREVYRVVLISPKRARSKISDQALTRDGLQSQIVLIPPVSNRELIMLFSTASLFVYPSYYEGFGFPVLEAMRCECPSSAPTVVRSPKLQDRQPCMSRTWTISQPVPRNWHKKSKWRSQTHTSGAG